MKRRTQLIAGVVLLTAAVFGLTWRGLTPAPSRAFLQANEAYDRGDYTQAVGRYNALLAREGYSAPVLYNLGNAWLKLNQPGRAILSYERALALAPLDSAITGNLHLAQQLSGHAPAAPSFFDSVRKALSLDTIAVITTFAAVALATVVLTARRRHLASPLLYTLATASALLLLACGTLLLARSGELDQAVILSKAAPVRVAPADAADTTFVLSSGAIVQVGKPYHSFIQVRTDDGRTGWVHLGQLERILAPSDRTDRIA